MKEPVNLTPFQTPYNRFNWNKLPIQFVHIQWDINRLLGTPVSTGKKAKSKRYVFIRLLKVATEVAERTDSGRLFQREGVQERKALAPVVVLILGMDRVIPLFDLI